MQFDDFKKDWQKIGDEFEAMRIALVRSDMPKEWKWDSNDFLDTGRKEIDEILNYIRSLNLTVSHRKALDFGCGPGRLTQAMAAHFQESYGVDVSRPMLDAARKFNTLSNCFFIENTRDDLMVFENGFFDFIYSTTTLQHMELRYSLKYISEFLRILHDDGVLIFQLPCKHPPLRTIDHPIKRYLRKVILGSCMEVYYRAKYSSWKRVAFGMSIYPVERRQVTEHVSRSNGHVVDIHEINPISLRYCITKWRKGI